MYCKDCGHQLPDDANFCSKCGNPQREGVTSGVQEEPKWETCEVFFRILKQGGIFSQPVICWVAVASGENGKYDAAVSEQFLGDKQPYGGDGTPFKKKADIARAHEALTNLENKMLKDGWDYLGLFGDWYWAKRFRKRMK